ncbi:MAG: GIY-YIG nuclease family protein [Candidatus Omnitrophica bacterium]|nr:GIY-YIG nuclease family protein [Candidatus Omnitrophota bacterium]
MIWYVYIIRCRDNTLYTGITNNLKRRIREHNSGKGCRYTKCRWPVELTQIMQLALFARIP